MLRGLVIAVSLVSSLAGCGETQSVENARAPDGDRTDPAALTGHSTEPAESATPPAIAPRWIAAHTRIDSGPINLAVVRFDDVERPETIALATGADGETTELGLVEWSPNGEHVAYVIQSTGHPPSLWVASARDDFARRQVLGLPELADPTDVHRFSWMGANTLVITEQFVGGAGYYRVAADSLEPEALAEPGSGGGVYAASEFGLLYTATAADDTVELLYAEERGSPRRLAAAPSASGAELAWSPDGRSATWWTMPVEASAAVLTTTGTIGVVTLGGAAPPAAEIAAEPTVTHVHVPSGTVVDAHPHGDLVFSNEFRGRAMAPEGPGYAYAVYRDGSALVEAGGSIVVGAETAFEVADGSGQSMRQSFGFLDRRRFFYSRVVDGGASGEIQAEIALRTDGVERILSTARYVPAHLLGFAQHDRVVFARSEADRRSRLWTVNLANGEAQAEEVPLDGPVVLDSLLEWGETRPSEPGTPIDALGPVILLAISDDIECRYLGCHTGWAVVDFRDGIVVTPVEYDLARATATWTPDGAGLIAVSGGLRFIPGPGYRGSFELHPDVVEVLAPRRWPASAP